MKNSHVCSEEGVEGGTIRSERTRGSNSIRHSCVQRMPLATPCTQMGLQLKTRAPLREDGQSLGTDLATGKDDSGDVGSSAWGSWLG